MTYQQLIYFCTACECGSVTKAAEKLFVTQPAITSAIRHLEKEYHLQILERKDKNMRLTPDGKIFLENAKKLVQHTEVFDKEMYELGQRGKYLRLGLSKSVGANIYTEYFAYGFLRHPEINIETISGSSGDLLTDLRENRLDVALVPSQTKDSMDDLECVFLKNTDMLYCMSESHPLAKKEELEIADIVDEKMVSTCKDENKARALERLFEAAGYEQKPKIVKRFEQLNTALAMIGNNLGTGYFSTEIVRQYEGVVGKKIKGDPPIAAYVV